jgi:chromosome segregation ATPase
MTDEPVRGHGDDEWFTPEDFTGDDGVSGQEKSHLFDQPAPQEPGAPDSKLLSIISERDALQAQIAKLQDASRKEYGFLLERFERIVAENERLERMLEDPERSGGKDTEEQNELRDRLRSVQAEKQRLADERQRLLNQIESMTTQQEELESDFGAITGRVDELTSSQVISAEESQKISEDADQIGMMQERVQFLLKELEAAQAARGDIDLQYADLHRAHLEAVQELERIKTDQTEGLTDDDRRVMQERIEYLLQEVESIRTERDEAELRFAELHRENIQLREDLEAARTATRKVETAPADAPDAKSDTKAWELQEHLKRLRDELKVAKDDKDRIHKESEALREDAIAMEEQQKELEKELAKVRRDLVDMQSKFEEARPPVEELLSGDESEKSKRLLSLQADKERLVKENLQITLELQRIRDTLKEVPTGTDVGEKEKTGLFSMFRKKGLGKEELQALVQEQATEIAELQKRLKILTSELDRTEDVKDSLKEKFQRVNLDLLETRRMMKQSGEPTVDNEELDAVKADRERLAHELAELQARMSEHISEKVDAVSTAERLQKEVENLRTQVNLLMEANAATLSGEVAMDRSADALNELESENAELHDQLAELQTELTKAQEARLQSDQQIAALAEQLSEATQDHVEEESELESENAELHDKLTAAQQELIKAEEAAAQAQQVSNTLRADVAQLQHELQEARNLQATEEADRVADLEAARDLLNEQLEEMQQQLAEAAMEKMESFQTIESLKQQVQDLELEVTRGAEETRVETQRIIDKLDEEKLNLDLALEAAQRSATESAQRLAVMEQEFGALRRELRETERNLADLLVAKDVSDSARERAEEQVKSLQSRLNDAEQDIQRRKEDAEAEALKRKEVEQDRRTLQADLNLVEDQAQELRTRLKESEARAKALQAQIDAQESVDTDELAALKVAHRAAEEKIAGLEGSIETMAAERDRAIRTSEQWEGDLADALSDLDALQTESMEYRDALAGLKAERDRILAERDEAAAARDEYSAKIDTLERAEVSLRKELEQASEATGEAQEELVMTISGLKAEIDHFKEEVSNRERMLGELIKDKEGLEKQIKSLEKELAGADKAIERARKDADKELRKDLKKLEKSEERLQGRIDKGKATIKELRAERRKLYSEKKKLAEQIERLSEQVLAGADDPDTTIRGGDAEIWKEVAELRGLFEALQEERALIRERLQKTLGQNDDLLRELDALRRRENLPRRKKMTGTELRPGLRLIDDEDA